MKSKQIIIGSVIVVSLITTMTSSGAFAKPGSPVGAQPATAKGSKEVKTLKGFTSALAKNYRNSTELAVDLSFTSMAPFLKGADKYDAQTVYQPAIAEFLAPTLLAFSVTYSNHAGKAASTAPLKETVSIPGLVLTWGEAQARADFLAKERGLPEIRAQQNQLSLQMSEKLEKKDIEGYYALSAQMHALGQKAIQILDETHNEAYGEMAKSPALISNRDADKIGMVKSPTTETRVQPHYYHQAYNRLLELKAASPKAFDQILKEMTVDPTRYFATLILKYQAPNVSLYYQTYAKALKAVDQNFQATDEESQILAGFADLTAATIHQRDLFGSMITPRSNSATYLLGTGLLRVLTPERSLTANERQSLYLGTTQVLDLGRPFEAVGRAY